VLVVGNCKHILLEHVYALRLAHKSASLTCGAVEWKWKKAVLAINDILNKTKTVPELVFE
jgi:hypothetical protein